MADAALVGVGLIVKAQAPRLRVAMWTVLVAMTTSMRPVSLTGRDPGQRLWMAGLKVNRVTASGGVAGRGQLRGVGMAADSTLGTGGAGIGMTGPTIGGQGEMRW